jgi:hypothetical protein
VTFAVFVRSFARSAGAEQAQVAPAGVAKARAYIDGIITLPDALQLRARRDSEPSAQPPPALSLPMCCAQASSGVGVPVSTAPERPTLG